MKKDKTKAAKAAPVKKKDSKLKLPDIYTANRISYKQVVRTADSSPELRTADSSPVLRTSNQKQK